MSVNIGFCKAFLGKLDFFFANKQLVVSSHVHAVGYMTGVCHVNKIQHNIHERWRPVCVVHVLQILVFPIFGHGHTLSNGERKKDEEKNNNRKLTI